MVTSRLCSPSAWRLRLMLLASAVLLLASVVLMAGATYAWFTDSVVNEGNTIRAAEKFSTPDPAPASGGEQSEPLGEDEGVGEGEPVPPDGQQVEGEPPPDPGEPKPGESQPAEEGEGGAQPEPEGPSLSEAGG